MSRKDKGRAKGPALTNKYGRIIKPTQRRKK